MLKFLLLLALLAPLILVGSSLAGMILMHYDVVSTNCMPLDPINPRFWRKERLLKALVFKRFTKPLDKYGYIQEGEDEYGILWRMHANSLQPIVNHGRVRRIPRRTGRYVDWGRRAASRQCIIEVKDATTGHTHYLAVPWHTGTPKEGVAWTFGLPARDYNPVKQT